MRVDDLDSDGVLVNYAEIYLLADYPLYCWQGEQDHYHLAHARVRGHVNGSTGHRIYNDTKTPLEHSPDLAAWARRSRSWVCTIWRKEPSIIGKDEDIAATLELARASTMLLIKVNAAGTRSPGGAVATGPSRSQWALQSTPAMETLIGNDRFSFFDAPERLIH
ncbi:hypothetical protein PC121_g15772 [Phytophthora cactorum]|nr:hypothetical protein PC120_g20588 [Phytophthora cactorum]KAG3055467.1 hypothetical protein PC121_g15772 [Phytophthora cactorum]